jgi:hypothetical protein
MQVNKVQYTGVGVHEVSVRATARARDGDETTDKMAM